MNNAATTRKPKERTLVERNASDLIRETTRLRSFSREDRRYARETDGRIDFRGAKLTRMTRADLDVSWFDLSGADLRGAVLSGSPVAEQADFSDADIGGIKMRHADVRGSVFLRTKAAAADLHGLRAPGTAFSDVDLRDAILAGADLRACSFLRCDFSGADLSSADLHGASVEDCVFERTKLSDAKLTEINVRNVRMTKCDLSGADASSSVWTNVEIDESDMSGIVLRNSYVQISSIRKTWLDGAVLGEGGRALGCVATTFHHNSYENVVAAALAGQPAMVIDQKLAAATAGTASVLGSVSLFALVAGASWFGLPDVEHLKVTEILGGRGGASAALAFLAVPLLKAVVDRANDFLRDKVGRASRALGGKFYDAVNEYVSVCARNGESLSRKLMVFTGGARERRSLLTALEACAPRGGALRKTRAFATELGHVVFCDGRHFIGAMEMLTECAKDPRRFGERAGGTIAVITHEDRKNPPQRHNALLLREDGALDVVWTFEGKAVRRERFAPDGSHVSSEGWNRDGSVADTSGWRKVMIPASRYLDPAWLGNIPRDDEIPATRVTLSENGTTLAVMEFDTAGAFGRLDAASSGDVPSAIDPRQALAIGRPDLILIESEGKPLAELLYENGRLVSAKTPKKELSPKDVAPAWRDADAVRRTLIRGFSHPFGHTVSHKVLSTVTNGINLLGPTQTDGLATRTLRKEEGGLAAGREKKTREKER
jgi:uncharacterized protein YjbI with pentapeptide repeats